MSQNVSISAERYEVDTEAPLTNFSHCHIGILHQIDRLSSLPDLLGPAMLAKRIAAQSLEYFHHGMHAHHQEEEKELFPAVQDSAQAGEERLQVYQWVQTLLADHRMSVVLSAVLARPFLTRLVLAVVDTNNWTRTNFARWMFEDEPRAIVLTPRRWHRKFFSRSGAYES